MKQRRVNIGRACCSYDDCAVRHAWLRHVQTEAYAGADTSMTSTCIIRRTDLQLNRSPRCNMHVVLIDPNLALLATP